MSPQDFEQTIIKLLDLGTDSIEKLAPHADKLADLFIIYGLYQTGKDAGINPFWGPLSYRLATAPEENPGEIAVGFGWGASQIQVPASTRMIGVLGLASMGLAISLSQLSEAVKEGTGPGPEIPVEAYVPPAIPESDFQETIEQNTETSYVEVEGIEEQRYTIDWKEIENSFSALPKVGVWNVGRRLQQFRRAHYLDQKSTYTNISKNSYDKIVSMVSEALSRDYERQRKWMEIITGNAVANIYPGLKFTEKEVDKGEIPPGVYGGVYG